MKRSRPQPWFFKFRLLSVDQVVATVIRGARRPGTFLLLPSLDIRLVWALLRFLPRTFTRLMVRLYRFE